MNNSSPIVDVSLSLSLSPTSSLNSIKMFFCFFFKERQLLSLVVEPYNFLLWYFLFQHGIIIDNISKIQWLIKTITEHLLCTLHHARYWEIQR